MERMPTPGSQLGLADHAPTQTVVEAGAGPGAEHRFSRELASESFLMHKAPHMTP